MLCDALGHAPLAGPKMQLESNGAEHRFSMPGRWSPPHLVSWATPWPGQGVKHARHACHDVLVKFGPSWSCLGGVLTAIKLLTANLELTKLGLMREALGRNYVWQCYLCKDYNTAKFELK